MSLLRRCLIIFCLLYTNIICDEFEVPDVTIQAITPKGLRVILKDSTNITAFLFDGTFYKVNVTRFSPDNVVTRTWGFGTKTDFGTFVYEDHDIVLKERQFALYRVFVSTTFGDSYGKEKGGVANYTLRGYVSNERVELITELVDPSAGPKCPESITKVRGRRVCKGETIFEDNFDTLREENWQIAHYIPIDHPEHPFVSYQRLQKDPTVSVENGMLRISPKLQQDLFKNSNQSILSGTLDLTSGCTELRICSMSSIGVDIVPPVVSGRVTSARFAFTYGTVRVRAKLPQGDWLYPEILLEPLSKKYGNLNYASGILKIAMVPGNMDINSDRYSNRWLTGGPILNSRCRSALEFYHKKTSDDKFWGDDFHVFEIKWTPEEITLSVDEEEWGRYTPGYTGLRSWLPATCRGDWYELLNTGGRMAPFDDHFYLTLGVAVGGIVEFSDGLTTGEDHPKPWRNRGRKAGFSFWQDRNNWLPTWTQPDLLIDYIKVEAL